MLERAVLPASLTTVETGAFNEVPEEITVEYNGRRYLWEQIDFSEGNEIIQTAEVICHPAEEDKIPAETPVIRYQDDYGVLNKATGETTVKEGTVVSLPEKENSGIRLMEAILSAMVSRTHPRSS